MADVQIRFARSARRHKIGKAHTLAAMNNAGEPVRDAAPHAGLSDTLTWI